MVLPMTRPTKHPKTGVYRLRKGVPAKLRAAVGKRELVVSLRTKDAKLAKANAVAELERFESILAAARGDTRPQPTMRQIDAAIGTWYHAESAKLADDPGTQSEWDEAAGHYSDMFASEPGEPPEFHHLRTFLDATAAMLRAQGIVVDQATLAVAAERWARANHAFAKATMAKAGGDWTTDPTLAKFPTGAHSTPPAAPTAVPVSLRGLLKGWESVTSSKPRTVVEARYSIENWITFIGHDDAARITPDELIRYRTANVAAGRVANTWNNRLSQIAQILAHGVSERTLKANAADGLRLRKSTPVRPPPYSNDDAARILKAARKESGPSRRWAHWVMAFSGMRVAEVLQMTRYDVRQDAGIWFMSVNEAGAGKSVKTGMVRHVPMHPALIAEGFLAHVKTISDDGPIFADKGLDRHGSRGGRGWNLVGKWVRDTVGITDPLKAPNHSWRHRMEDELRAVGVPEPLRDSILGHARATTGRSYGARGESLRHLHEQLSLVPAPPGLMETAQTPLA